ncbi:MAG: SoxR reducing system RseC family protein [Alkalispirochaetaceae bacterium]
MHNPPGDDQRIIYHEGVAEDVDGTRATVRFVQSGACGSCQIKSVCNPAEQRTRIVTACHDGRIRAGDQVRVGVSESVAWLSILCTFLFPFLLVAGVFFLLYFRTGSDLAAAVGGLGILPFYYLTLYLFRNQLAGAVRFTAVPVTGIENRSMRGIS